MTDLETLVIRGFNAEEADLEFLSELKGLKNLVLNGNLSISQDTAKRISTLTTLEYLALDGIQIDNEAIGQFRNCNRLQTLQLDSTLIDDAGLRSLHSMSNLRRLSVRGTKVTSMGIAELQKVLPEVQVLSKFGESWSSFSAPMWQAFSGRGL